MGEIKTLVRKIFEKSSFHGFAYIVRRDIHWIERSLWGVILLFATYFSISICWDQWERYKQNPTVLAVERVEGTREFPYMGFTACSKYFDHDQARRIIQETWKVVPGEENFTYYEKFLQDLSNVRYDNLNTLKPYENDTTVNNVPFLKILWEIRSTLLNTKSSVAGRKSQEIGTVQYGGIDKPYLNDVITEVGMCITTSLLHEYQDPRGFKGPPEKLRKHDLCSPFDTCTLKITPIPNDSQVVTTYIHSNNDIVPHDDKEVIRRENTTQKVTNLDVSLQLMTAEKEVRNVPIQYRKCRFEDENNLKYFKTYRPILCRNECRINAALKLCNCKPFFYVVGKGPTCTVQGMLCLVSANWNATKCNECLELCSTIKFRALRATAQDFGTVNFEGTMTVGLTLPKMGINRRVVFSADQLVVTFGGAASLFLGCSFLSFAQILYYCIQAIGAKFKQWYNRVK